MENVKGNGGILWKRTEELFGRPRNEWTTIDGMIYGTDDYFNVQREEAEKQRLKAIREAFNHHYSNNLFYNRLCKDRGVKPDDIKTEKDFAKIPMVPDTFFKDYPSEDPRKIYEWLYRCSSVDIGKFDFNGGSLQKFLEWAERRLKGIVNHSSGTSGKFSIMFRDKVTSQRAFYSFIKSLLTIVPPNDDTHLIYPGPAKTYLTFGHWVAVGTRIFDDLHKHFLTDRTLTMDIVRLMSTGQAKGFKEKMELRLLEKASKKGQSNILKLLEKYDKEKKQVYLLSFPFQLYDMMKTMEEEGKELNLGESDSIIITAAGWKIYENKKISEKEFAKIVEKNLGVPQSNYRDVYGMSEMNALAIGCEGRYKHLSPWIYPMILDDNLEPVGYDEWGRFAFLDPVAHSYPGFIMSGDRVKILEECPKCDKTGVVLESEITRMAGAEGRGCGNLMRNLLAEEIAESAK
jgi:phenylacetate-coenzyme A ligase PaaK-like adenylate-forming protein